MTNKAHDSTSEKPGLLHAIMSTRKSVEFVVAEIKALVIKCKKKRFNYSTAGFKGYVATIPSTEEQSCIYNLYIKRCTPLNITRPEIFCPPCIYVCSITL